MTIGGEDRSSLLRRTGKGTSLLALLVMADGASCDPLYLQERLWPDNTDHERRATNFRQQLRRVRDALGDCAGLLVTDRPGLRLDTAHISCDLTTFLRRVGQREWQAAVDAYGGPLLPACGDEWAEEERERLHNRLIEALAALAAQQPPEAALVTLDRWRQESPESDEPLRLRWQCLVSLNRLPQALREVEAHGDPDGTIRAGLEQFNRSRRSRDFPPLPAPWTRLVGREAELEHLLVRVRGERLFTLCGEGGIGKTRLALELAHHLYRAFDSQVAFIDLSALPPGTNDVTLRALLEQTVGESVESLCKLRALLVLDNAEHVLPAVRSLARLLLDGSRDLQLLITSRQELGYRQERKVWLKGLLPADSRTLFRQVSPVVEPYDPTVDAVLDRICNRLEGWPLAIELAASRRSAFASLEQLEANLERALLEADPAPDDATVAERSRTLETTLEWSARQLDPALRRIWASCPSFVGGIAPAILARVIGYPEAEVQAALDRLAALSLVRRQDSRYRLLEPVRAYLSAEETTRPAFAAYFRDWVKSGPSDSELEEERGNVAAAGEWFQAESPADALEMGAALWRFWRQHGSQIYGLGFLERALEVAGEHPDRTEALLGASALAYALRLPIAAAYGAEAQARTAASGDSHGEARAWLVWGLAALIDSDATEADHRFDRAEALFTSLGDARGVRLARANRILSASQSGNTGQVLALHEAALAEFAASGNVDDWLTEANNLVYYQVLNGLEDQAAIRLVEVLTVAQRRPHRLALLQALQACLDLLPPAAATTLLGGLDQLRIAWGLPLAVEAREQDEADRWNRERVLGRSAFQEALEQGASMSQEALVEWGIEALKKLSN